MEAFGAFPVGDLVETPAEIFVSTRAGEQSSSQRTVVKTRTPDENRESRPSLDVADGALGIFGKPRCRVDLDWIGDVDQVMGNAAPLLVRQLVGADVEAAIDRGGIAVDDFAAE